MTEEFKERHATSLPEKIECTAYQWIAPPFAQPVLYRVPNVETPITDLLNDILAAIRELQEQIGK